MKGNAAYGLLQSRQGRKDEKKVGTTWSVGLSLLPQGIYIDEMPDAVFLLPGQRLKLEGAKPDIEGIGIVIRQGNVVYDTAFDLARAEKGSADAENVQHYRLSLEMAFLAGKVFEGKAVRVHFDDLTQVRVVAVFRLDESGHGAVFGGEAFLFFLPRLNHGVPSSISIPVVNPAASPCLKIFPVR